MSTRRTFNPATVHLRRALFCVILAVSARSAMCQPCDPHWSDEFAGTVLYGPVHAFAAFDDGSGPTLVAGGDIQFLRFTPIDRIARWDGRRWSPMGEGFNVSVYSLAVHDDGLGGGDALYAGGGFTQSGADSVLHLARWNGMKWEEVGGGIESGRVYSLLSVDDESGPGLIVAGIFAEAGSVPAESVARWDGRTWSPLGEGIIGIRVDALAVFDDGDGPALYAAGAFHTAGGVAASNIARWDGLSWSALGEGVNGRIVTMAAFDDGSGPALYVGGEFTQAGGLSAGRIARWDGRQWSSLSEDFPDGVVNALQAFDDPIAGPSLYAAGVLGRAAGEPPSGVLRWNSAEWFEPGLPNSGPSTTLGVFVDRDGVKRLAVAGIQLQPDVGTYGTESHPFALWSGREWSVPTFASVVDAIATLRDTESGRGVPYIASRLVVARWDDGLWTYVGSFSDDVVSLQVHEATQNLFAGGRFDQVGDLPANSIARWDGTTWHALGDGLNGDVLAMAIDLASPNEISLYVGGGMSPSSGYLAHWDGAKWTTLGLLLNGSVRAIAIGPPGPRGEPNVIIGGTFTASGETVLNRIARWNGTEFLPLSAGVSGSVNALAFFDDESGAGPALFAAGPFAVLGTTGIGGLAKWDGEIWQSIGDVPNFPPRAMTVFDDHSGVGPALYVTGCFEQIGDLAIRGIARWDGQRWSAPDLPGLGPDEMYPDGGCGNALAGVPGGSGSPASLLIAGQFDSAGGLPSSQVARWIGCATTPSADLNGDGLVGVQDLEVLLAAWSIPPGSPGCGGKTPCPADLNRDGAVDGLDLGLLLASWSRRL